MLLQLAVVGASVHRLAEPQTSMLSWLSDCRLQLQAAHNTQHLHVHA